MKGWTTALSSRRIAGAIGVSYQTVNRDTGDDTNVSPEEPPEEETPVQEAEPEDVGDTNVSPDEPAGGESPVQEVEPEEVSGPDGPPGEPTTTARAK